jgi:hypothetical protein
MEALQIVLPGEVHPVRNSSPAIAGLKTERGNISDGVNIVSYCALGSARCRQTLYLVPRLAGYRAVRHDSLALSFTPCALRSAFI